MNWPFQVKFTSLDHCIQTLNWGFDLKDAEDAAKKLIAFIEERFGFKVENFDNGLDLGCGYGRLAKVLANKGLNMDGMDVNNDLAQYYKEYMNKDLLLYNGRQIPFPDASISVLCSTLVFKHLTSFDFRNLLYEIERVIKPGGILFFDILKSPIAWVDLDNVMHDHDNEMLSQFLQHIGFKVDSEQFSPRKSDHNYQRVYYANKPR